LGLNSILEDENSLVGNVKEYEMVVDVADSTSKALADYAVPGWSEGPVHICLDPYFKTFLRFAISSCIEI
jgi:hypothetical protein